MTTQTKRCIHCKVKYRYHPSGSDHPLNNDTYCPDCYEVVLKALENVPIKKKSTYLPVIPGTSNPDITLEEIEKARSEIMFPNVIRLAYGSKITHHCVPKIRDVNYELWEKKETGEKMIVAEYEEDIVTGEITGVW